MASLLWYIVAALHAVSLVSDIVNGAPSLEHEALMLLALVLAKIDALDQCRRIRALGEAERDGD